MFMPILKFSTSDHTLSILPDGTDLLDFQITVGAYDATIPVAYLDFGPIEGMWYVNIITVSRFRTM